jgi:hypothetical protein
MGIRMPEDRLNRHEAVFTGRALSAKETEFVLFTMRHAPAAGKKTGAGAAHPGSMAVDADQADFRAARILSGVNGTERIRMPTAS